MPAKRREQVEIPSEPNKEADGASIDFHPQENEAVTEQAGLGNTTGADTGANTGTGADTGANTGTGADASGASDGDSGAGSRHPLDDGDPRIIRDEYGNPTFSPTGRLRKRRAGSTRSATEGQATAKGVKKVPVDALSRLLMMGHAITANITKTPELEINGPEARMLADPLSELLLLYEVEPDPRLMAMMELGLAASYVYGPRIAMIRARLHAERLARAEARAAEEARTISPGGGVEPDLPFFAPAVNPNAGPLGRA